MMLSGKGQMPTAKVPEDGNSSNEDQNEDLSEVMVLQGKFESS